MIGNVGKNRASWVLYSLVVLVSFAPLAVAQSLESRLAGKVDIFDSERASTIEQLADFGQLFQIPMGIEWLHTTGEKPVRPIHVRDATVQDVLREILKQAPSYQLRISEGVVEIFPASLINDRLDFLNLRLPRFRVKNENLFGAEHELRIRIQQLLHPTPGFGGGYGGVGLHNDFHIRKITFSGNDLTVRQILNNIAALQGNALWVVRLKQSEMMKGEPFYAQTTSLTGEDVAADFFWQFMPLRKTTRQ